MKYGSGSKSVACLHSARCRLLAPGLFLLLALLAACSRTNAPALQASPAGRELRVGVVADHPPFAYLAGDGQPEGFDAALAQEIARRLDGEIEWIDLPVSRLVENIRRGRLDLAVVSLRSLDELALPAAAEDGGIQVDELARQPSGEMTVLLLAAGNRDLWAEASAALAQMRQQGLIPQLEKQYLAVP